MSQRWDRLWINARLATMADAGFGTIEDGALAVSGGRIAWLGPRAALDPAAARGVPAEDAGGRWITPALIDCHTHLVFGGDRAHEFEQRLEGASYEQIARAGGGIRSTVAATRAAGEEALLAGAVPRAAALLAEGVTTIEVKSGYGLDRATELTMLRAARRIGERLPVTIVTTFLGAHAVPPEYEGRQGDYMDLVIGDMLPAVAAAGLADAVDAFAERIGFTIAETERLFAAAQALGLPVKLHAEQLSDLGGAALAGRFGALSADHLEHASEAGVAAMARAGTVAVLLPGAFYFLRETKLPPIEALRRHGVAMAVASDANPGSSPARSLLLMLSMACTLFRMTPLEALAGVTRNAAHALGLAEERGTLAAGKAADFVVWDIGRPAELCYWIGGNPARQVVRGGQVVAADGKVLT